MLSAALCFVAALVTSASAVCKRSVSCPCGTSTKTYTFCVDGLSLPGKPCSRWSQCETCRDDYPYCLTCPSGRFGGLCITDSSAYQNPDIECVPQDPIDNGQTHRTMDTKLPFKTGEYDFTDMENPVGTQLQYVCNPGYSLEGAMYITCDPTGFWSGDPPVCVEDSSLDLDVECVPLSQISNGKMHRVLDPNVPPELITDDSYDVEFPVGTLMQYSCDLGYILEGERNLFCQPNGFWSAKTPVCVEDCGVSVVEPTPKLTNANRTVAGEWPWMVAILEPTRNNYTSIICGGSLLDKRTVLTAAHCFNRNAPYYVMHFGKYYRKNSDTNGVEIRTNFEIIIHPEFNKDTYENDIAVLKLRSDLQYTERILPICLPTPVSSMINLVPGNLGYVTGWGITEVQLPADVLMMTTLPVQSADTCMASFKKEGLSLQMGPGMFCAGFPQGRISACKGDSGSAFFFYNWRTRRYTVEGCVSFSVEGQCGLPGRYTVYTKVSNFLDWIEKA